MKSLTVYTKEIFYYSNSIIVCVMQDRFDENVCRISCKHGGHIVFYISLNSSIYNIDGVSAIIEMEFKRYGISADLKYSIKRFTYVVKPMVHFRYLDFEASGSSNGCFIRFWRDNTSLCKVCYLPVSFDDIKLLRYWIDNLFWNMVSRAVYLV